MKDNFLYFFAIAIAILLILGISKLVKNDSDAKEAAIEFDKPENQFKRKKKEFIKVLSDFFDTNNYPYITLSSYLDKIKATEISMKRIKYN